MATHSSPQDISFDAVAEAAERLRDAGTPVNFEALRAEFGEGSPIALLRHLDAWRAGHETASVALPRAELPAALVADLNKWAEAYAHDAGAGVREALARTEGDLRDALDAGAALEAEADGAAAARDAAQAMADERSEEIERLTAELRNARQIAMDALVGKAKDQLAIEGKDAQLLDLRGQLERNVAASSAQSDARLAAEMELIGATTARDSLALEVKDLQAQLAAAKSDRGALRMELDKLRKSAK
jgi:hypothetical protein